ncbi:MAG: ABC transporter ATP-binding protein [Janthinobacterium lividum]
MTGFRLAEAASASVAAPAVVKLHAQGLYKAYGASVALQPIELKVRSGELLTLLGPSGSGKTTLLQLICGLVEPTNGRLIIDGRDQTDVPASKRDIGVVFQNYALFPHLTVAENVAFPLQMRKLAPAPLRTKVGEALAMVGLADFGKRFPSELSGGQQQRVALARCLVYAPSLILMDESLSALDRKLRENLQIEIKRIHRGTGSTIIFVTHDQEEALALSDRICLMSQGTIAQLGTPQEIYEEPASAFVADFIGLSNLFRGTVDDRGQLVTADGALPLPPRTLAAPGTPGAIVIRPEHITTDRSGALLSGLVTESIYAGSETRLLVTSAGGTTVTVRRPAGSAPLALGSPIAIAWRPEQARFLQS